MSAILILHPRMRQSQILKLADELSMGTCRRGDQLLLVPIEPASIVTWFECQRCEWRGREPVYELVEERDCEFPVCPACSSFNVMLMSGSTCPCPAASRAIPESP